MSGTGHYTQMVWASTYKIGCGYAAYRRRNFVKKFIVCNYGDAGNLLNAPMYQVGRPCSKCPANICSRRFPGLCPVPGETGFSPSNSTMVDINTDVESIRPSTPAGSDGKNYFIRECVSTGAAGARTRRSLGHHLLHPLILRLLQGVSTHIDRL